MERIFHVNSIQVQLPFAIREKEARCPTGGKRTKIKRTLDNYYGISFLIEIKSRVGEHKSSPLSSLIAYLSEWPAKGKTSFNY